MEKKHKLDVTIQKAIDKLVSDEWFAGQLYRQFILLIQPNGKGMVGEELLEISNDELDDHFKSLVEFALSYGFSVPSTYNEMKKNADKDDVKLFENCKRNDDVLFYINLAIESEKRAIKTYQKYVDDYDFAHDFSDLKLIVQNNYYDEVDHLNKLNFMKNSIEAMQQFN